MESFSLIINNSNKIFFVESKQDGYVEYVI